MPYSRYAASAVAFGGYHHIQGLRQLGLEASKVCFLESLRSKEVHNLIPNMTCPEKDGAFASN